MSALHSSVADIWDQLNLRPREGFQDDLDPDLQRLSRDITPLLEVDTEPRRMQLFDMINQQTRGLSEQIETNLNVRGLRGGGSQGLGAFTGLKKAELDAKSNVMTDLLRQQEEGDIRKADFFQDLFMVGEGRKDFQLAMDRFGELGQETERQGGLDILGQLIELLSGSSERLGGSLSAIVRGS